MSARVTDARTMSPIPGALNIGRVLASPPPPRNCFMPRTPCGINRHTASPVSPFISTARSTRSPMQRASPANSPRSVLTDAAVCFTDRNGVCTVPPPSPRRTSPLGASRAMVVETVDVPMQDNKTLSSPKVGEQSPMLSLRPGLSLAVQPLQKGAAKKIGGSCAVVAAGRDGHRAVQRMSPRRTPSSIALAPGLLDRGAKHNLLKPVASAEVRTDTPMTRARSHDHVGVRPHGKASHTCSVTQLELATSPSRDALPHPLVQRQTSGKNGLSSSSRHLSSRSSCFTNLDTSIRKAPHPSHAERYCSPEPPFARWASSSADDRSVRFATLASAGYRVTQEQELGHGAQGIVKLGQNAAGVPCSLKCVRRAESGGQKLDSLHEEFRILRTLDSPFIARVVELFQDSEFCFMVGEPYLGGDFCTLLPQAEEQKVALVEDWWRTLVRQCFQGLAYLHGQGFVHCDIKEPNLMLKTRDLRQLQVVIIDFGLALPAGSLPDDKKRGTMGYIPPETYETKQWHPQGDVFSMGVVMAQLLLYVVPVSPSRGSMRCGAFTAGVHTSGDVRRTTSTRHLDPLVAEMLPMDYSGLTNLFPKIVATDLKDRLSAQQLLEEPWFSQQQVSNVEFNPRVAKIQRQLRKAAEDKRILEQQRQQQQRQQQQQQQRRSQRASAPQLPRASSQTLLPQSQMRMMHAAYPGNTCFYRVLTTPHNLA
mmetsp:Transcript_5805/g.10869  ORF Transcript_5805/g.10869 Transcript_5805/m.10869 type:complete len:706 (-) Transcript_5805:1-2118(-)